jgi:hypothetical protein
MAKSHKGGMTQAKKQAMYEEALERQRVQEEKKKDADRTKKIFTVVVCVVLVFALGVPTVALSVLSM